MIVLSAAAPLIVKFGNHHPPSAIYYKAKFHAINPDFGTPYGPNGRFWFGVTRGAEDVFTRILYGIRVSMVVAFLATGISLVIGVVLGLLAGFYGGKIDTLISRFMDILLSFPIFLIALGISASCGGLKGCAGGTIRPGLGLVIMIIAFASWPYIARIVRGQVLSIREKEFVDASRMLGANDRRIIFREILPNLIAPIIVYSTLLIPTNILFEAALSFLGIGIQPPAASLGQMISDAVPVFREQWWNFAFPGVFLLAIVLAFNLLGDGLRDALEPGRAN
ncbi:MAG: ABC transporter permease [Actinomycetota bacterium]